MSQNTKFINNIHVLVGSSLNLQIQDALQICVDSYVQVLGKAFQLNFSHKQYTNYTLYHMYNHLSHHLSHKAPHTHMPQDLFLHVCWPSCSETLLKGHFQPLPVIVIVCIYICLNVANWTSFIWVCVFPQHLWKGADQAGEDFSDNLMKGGGRLKLKIKLVKIENFHGTPKLQGYWGCYDISLCIVCTHI